MNPDPITPKLREKGELGLKAESDLNALSEVVRSSADAQPPTGPVISDAKELPDAQAPREKSPSPTNLTPEEQMALYEQDLKENDWGHQPC